MVHKSYQRGLVRLFLSSLSLFACGAFGATTHDDGPPPVVDAGADVEASGISPVDAAKIEDASNDTADAADATEPCTLGSETLSLTSDGILNPSTATNHQDFSGNRICNFSVGLFCLVHFIRVKSAGKTITALKLNVPRSTSTDCGDACNGPGYHGAGTIVARHMRADWSAKANWHFRHPDQVAADTWVMDGAVGNNDSTAPIASTSVGVDDDATIVIDPAKLSIAFPGPDLAFHLTGQTNFEFVIQRSNGASASRATLEVTYCTK